MSNYEAMGREIGALVDKKQAAYGDSFGKSGEILRILYPNGIAPEQYADALAVVRIVDKLFRIATDRDALGESPYRDIAGYGLLGAARSASVNEKFWLVSGEIKGHRLVPHPGDSRAWLDLENDDRVFIYDHQGDLILSPVDEDMIGRIDVRPMLSTCKECQSDTCQGTCV